MQWQKQKQPHFTSSTRTKTCKPLRLPPRFASIQQQRNLATKAELFISKLRNIKKEQEGNIYLKKWAENKRKEDNKKKQLIEEELLKELKRKMRRMNAERNIEFFKEKKLSKLMRNQSYSPRKSQYSSITSINLQSQNLPCICEEDGEGCGPLGLQKTQRKSIKGRAYTQNTNHQPNGQRQEQSNAKVEKQQKLIHENKTKPTQLTENTKKFYVIRKNRSEDISEYIQQFTNISKIEELQKSRLKTEHKKTARSRKVNRLFGDILHSQRRHKTEHTDGRDQFQQPE